MVEEEGGGEDVEGETIDVARNCWSFLRRVGVLQTRVRHQYLLTATNPCRDDEEKGDGD